MTSRRYSLGLRIEGIGSDEAKRAGVCWYTGVTLSSAQKAASTLEWVGDFGTASGLAAMPDELDTSVDPATAEVRSSSYAFQLHFGAPERLLFTRTPPVSAEYLNNGIDESDTELYMSSGYDAANDGDIVFIGDECIKLGTYGGSSFTGCTRGYWGTQAQGWPKYTTAFTTNPYLTGRRVRLIRFDHSDDSETIVWRGFIDDWEGNEVGTHIVITCRETIAVLKEASCNLSAPDLSKLRPAPVHGHSGVDLRTSRGAYLAGYIAPGPSRRLRYKTTATHWGAFQVGEGLFFGRWDTGDFRYVLEDANTDPEISAPQLGSELPDEFEPIYEVLAVIRARDRSNGNTAVLTARRSGTAEMDSPYHPLSAPMALYLSSPEQSVSGFNGFGLPWGLAVPSELFDVSAIEDLIDRTESVEIDQLVLGWDGDPVIPWEVLQDHCRTYGFFPAVNSTYQVSIKQFREAAVGDIYGAATALTIPDKLHWQPRRGDSVDVIVGKFGALPWREGTPFVIQQLDKRGDQEVPRTSRRRGLTARRREQEIDMPTRSAVGELDELLLGKSLARSIAAPRFRLETLDDGFGLGDYVRVELATRDPWLPDEDGVAFTPAANSAKSVGMVTGMRRRLAKGTVDLEVMLLNRDGLYARERAPSAIAAGTGTAPTYDITDLQFTTNDEAQFQVGYKCEVWTSTGARRSGTSASPDVREITAIGPNSITFASSFTTAPQAGDVFRIAHMDDIDGSDETDSVRYPGYRAYAFLADASATLGPNDLEADVYGGAG